MTKQRAKSRKDAPKQAVKTLPVCQKCQSYKVSWDAAQPHSCVFFGFKSYQLPAVEVYNSTGLACPQFRLGCVHEKRAAEEQCRFQDHAQNSAARLDKGKQEQGLRYSASGGLLYDGQELWVADTDGQQQTRVKDSPALAQRENIDLGRILGGKGILL